VQSTTLSKWLCQADMDAGVTPGTASSESAELREARKRIRLWEQENEVLRRAAAYVSQAHLPGKALPAGERAGRRRDPRGGDVPGVGHRSPALLPVAGPTCHQRRGGGGVPGQRVVRRSDDPEFGYRFLVDEARDVGQPMADRTAWRICSGNGRCSAFGKRKRRGKGGKPDPGVHDEVLATGPISATGPATCCRPGL
jgi:putative transposase